MPLLALFLAIPLIEIALFITVGGWLTLWPTLGLVVLTALVGSFLVRRQGLATLGRLQQSMQQMTDPTTPLAHGAMILMAGMLLITPGFFTDTLGFLLLVPGVRGWLLQRIAARVVVMGPQGFGAYAQAPKASEDTVYAEATEVDGDAHPLPGRAPSGWTRPPEG